MAQWQWCMMKRSTCKSCCRKKDGLKGYCCSQGTGALNMDSEERLGIKPKCVQTHMAITHPNASKLAQKYSGTEKCPTCRDFEYASEGIIGAGKP